ncbi:MAG: nickel-responsive transcriptional regulator NikR [Geminicoccaceae bacterium]
MRRITISIDDDLLTMIEDLSGRRGYASRSEALRDIVREAILREPSEPGDRSPCLATLTYVYEHEKRDLARRITHAQHDHHDLSVATLHVHLDRENCLEVAVLRGMMDAVRSFADAITTQRGVRYGRLHVLPVEGNGGSGHAAHAPHPSYAVRSGPA